MALGHQEQKAFDDIKKALLDSTAVYKSDYDHLLVVMTDASDYGAGSVLLQRIDGETCNVGFFRGSSRRWGGACPPTSESLSP